MIETIQALGIWSWWILGFILLAVELAVPGSYMLWLGVSALAVGILSLGLAWPWQAQVVTFAGLSVLSVVWSRRYLGQEPESDKPGLNEPIRRFLGRTLTLREPIVSGVGRVAIDDTLWRVSGPDLPAGERVRIIGVDRAVLLVEPADQVPGT